MLLCAIAASCFGRYLVLELSVDGVESPVPFMDDDNLTEVAWAAVKRHDAIGGHGCRSGDRACAAALVEEAMTKLLAAAAPAEGEALGCPASSAEDTPIERLEPLNPLVVKARELSGPSRRLIVSMVTGAYAEFGLSLGKSLIKTGSPFLLVALDVKAARRLALPLGRGVVGIEGLGGAGFDEIAAFGTNAFRNVTRIKPMLVRAIHAAGINVFYVDADVVFLRDPWPMLESCPVFVQPVQMHADLAGAILAWEIDPRNPRPAKHYYGKALCSGLAYFAASDNFSTQLLARWQARVEDSRCGGDQAALEAAAASFVLESPTYHTLLCGLRLESFPHGMALKALGIESTLLSELHDLRKGTGDRYQTLSLPRKADDNLIAIHFNYVIGGSMKRTWASELGLWFALSDNDTVDEANGMRRSPPALDNPREERSRQKDSMRLAFPSGIIA